MSNIKREIKPEEIDAYTRHLISRKEEYLASIKKLESYILKVNAKLNSVESSLRKDLREGVISVYKAIGKTPPPPGARRKIKDETPELKTDPPKPKDDWDW